nr:Chain C, phospholipase C [synthetic construct]1IHJ_D Chain D, phospholipase C [synthetic construct]
GKTEFCA